MTRYVVDLSVNERVREADGAGNPIRFIIKGSITCEPIMESRRTVLNTLKSTACVTLEWASQFHHSSVPFHPSLAGVKIRMCEYSC